MGASLSKMGMKAFDTPALTVPVLGATWAGLVRPETVKLRMCVPQFVLFGTGQTPRTTCTCGQPLPLLEDYSFVFASVKKAHYLLGQCYRCRTIFWEEASL